MREIIPQRKAQANPWLWACVTLGACLAAFVVYDLMSSASSTDALVDVKAKASAREKELQRQIDHLKKSMDETDGRLANANLRIQELVTDRERRKAADEARNDYPRSTVSAESVKMLAGAPSNHTRRNDLLIADAVKDFYNGRVHAAKFKLEEIVMNDPTDVVACEVLVIVLRGVMEAEAAKRTAERTAGGR